MNKIKEYLIISWLLLLSVGLCNAQQQPISSQYMYNTLIVNPAFAGYYSEVDFTFSSEGQLNGIEGAPATTIFTASIPFNKVGWGYIYK